MPAKELCRLAGGKGAVVVGPLAARWAGARMRRLAWLNGGILLVIEAIGRHGTDINHPVGDLAHAESCDVAELFLLLFAWVGVIGMAVEPCLQVVSGLFGELSSFALGTVDEGGARDGLWGASRSVRDRDRGCRGGHGRRIRRRVRGR